MTIVVIGLDGASWNLLGPWVESDSLSNIKQIRKEGIYTDLDSCLPPVTSPNWKCYSTGKNPGKLGVYWWEVVDTANHHIRTPQSTDYRSAELWDYLNESGRPAAIINMPTTYPPRNINGWMISGGPGTKSEGFARPDALEVDLREQGYSVEPAEKIDSRAGNYETAVEAHIEAIESRFDVAERAIRSDRFDFIHMTAFYINVLQHFFWNGEPTYRAWQRINDRIGDILELADTVVLMSDHGCNRIRWEFRINQWLEDEGYLSLESVSTISNVLNRVGATRSRLRRIADAIPFDVRRLVPRSFKNSVPSEEGTLHRTAKASLIDWEHTSVVASGQGPIYVLADGTKRSRIIDELITELTAMTDPEGNHVCQAVHRGEDIYEGAYTDNAPDIVIEQNGGYHLPGSLGGEDIFSRPTRWLGENQRTGLFAAYGKSIADSGCLEDRLRITDLCPTLLHLLGESIPEDIDGEVRFDIFADGSAPKTRSPTYQSPIPFAGDEVSLADGAEEQLRDLGYL